MNVEEKAKEAAAEVRHTAENLIAEAKNSSAKVCQSVKEKSAEAAACASDRIRERPLPIVAGALAFGIVIGYLAAYRREPTLSELMRGRFDDAAGQARDLIPSNLADTVSHGFSRLGHNLKFW